MGQSQCTLDTDGAKVSFNNRGFASGEYRRAHKGKYLTGAKRGRPCVVKIYKSRRHENWEGEINIARTAKRVADAFNALPSRRRKGPVRILVPALGKVDSVGGCMAPARVGQRVTVEEFISGRYEKFVSNNGTFRFPGTLTAFAHFSYDHSGGEFIVIDLQGVRTDNGYVLTDPAIHSTVKGDIDSDFGRDGNPYGDLDLGNVGIEAFFSTHECEKACRGLMRPAKIRYDTATCERIMARRGSSRRVNPQGFAYF